MSSFYRLHAENQLEAQQEALSRLKEGGVLILPTDTLHGFSADYWNQEARKRVFQIKKRKKEKPFIILVPSIEVLLDFVDQDIPDSILQSLPNSLTLIVKNRYSRVYGEKTMALRFPRHVWLNSLMKDFAGPILSTSCNVSGQSPQEDQKSIGQFRELVDMIVWEEKEKTFLPSTLLDLSTSPYRLLRQGNYRVPSSLLED